MRHPGLSSLPLELRGYQHIARGLRQRCYLTAAGVQRLVRLCTVLVNDFKKARTHRKLYFIFHRSKFVATAI